MARKHGISRRILALSLGITLTFGGNPADLLAEEGSLVMQDLAAVTDQEADMLVEKDFVLGSKASYVGDLGEDHILKIGTSWMSSSVSQKESAAFANAQIFQKEAFSLSMDVYRQVISTSTSDDDSEGRNVTFSVGNTKEYFQVCLSAGGSLRYKNISDDTEHVVAFTGSSTVENKWNALTISYAETGSTGKVNVYVEGRKVIDGIDTGIRLSGLSDICANIGAGFGTGFMGKGLYKDICYKEAATEAAALEIQNRYTPYHTFSGSAEGILCSGNVNVNEWLDTNGEHIQAHGGAVQWLDTLDLDEDGIKEGGYIWYGEDKTRNGKPIDGIHCYTSPDLYNWTDRGMALSTHDVIPDQLDQEKDYIRQNTEGLNELKAWADMTEPSETVTAEQIDMAKAFVKAYRMGQGYDEENLKKAFKYLYSGYCIAERPKMLYNESTGQYVLVFHADGPSDANVKKYLQDGTFPSRYTRALMAFAVSDTPYGPFKLVNAQRMNYRTGEAYASATSTGMSRDMTVFKDDTDIDGDGVKDAYAIYSSEDNKYMYVSLLNSTYTASATNGTADQKEAADGTMIQTFADRVLGKEEWKEAPAVFKYDGYYYMITSGTTGWKANAASYYRAEHIYGPWKAMGDPCEGGSKDTFTSQPTAVITVDAEKGQFIYMGDRWSYTNTDGNNTDSAHWDSGYVWCPIDIRTDGSISILNRRNWSLDELEKVEIHTKLPKTVTSIRELPEKLNVSYRGQTLDTEVIWESRGEESFTLQQVSGILKDLDNMKIETEVAIAPADIIYFVDAGAQGRRERSFYYHLLENGKLKNTFAADQPYSKENKWGYVGNNTERRAADGNIYETLRYVKGKMEDRSLTYRFDDIKDGNYTVYIGLHDPASWYKGNRIADISISQDEKLLKSSQETYQEKGAEIYRAYDIEVKDADSLSIVLEPEKDSSLEGSDVQVSWIAIADRTDRKEESKDEPEPSEKPDPDKKPDQSDKSDPDEKTDSSDESDQDKKKDSSDDTVIVQPAETNTDSNRDTQIEKISAQKVTLNCKKLYVVKGKSITLKAVMTPSDTMDTLTWSSSKPSVATVKDGKITAKKTGSTTITVRTDSGKKAVCKVSVVKKAKKASSISLNKKKINIKKGNWYLLVPALKPAKSTDTIKWKSSDSKIASVDAYGYVTGKKKGTATITATTKSRKKVQCKVVVK